jgi:hypothetical protein
VLGAEKEKKEKEVAPISLQVSLFSLFLVRARLKKLCWLLRFLAP